MTPSANTPDFEVQPAGSWQGVLTLLSSMRLAVGVLALAGAACVAGMVIPQGEPLSVYQKAYGHFAASILYTGGLTDVYHSWWFLLLLAVVCASVAVCTVRRCAQVFRRSSSTKAPADEIARAKYRQAWRSSRPPDAVREAASSALGKAGYKVSVLGEAGGPLYVVGRKGAVGEWGGILMHVGLVMALVGAAYGHLPEVKLGGKVLLRARSIDFVRQVQEGGQFRPPGARFLVRLDRLRIPVDDLGRVKQYMSDLKIIEDGKVAASPTISVNYPYSRGGLSFYQTQWSLRGFVLKMTAPDGRTERVIIPVRPEGFDMMDSLKLLEVPHWIVFVHSFYPDAVEQDGEVVPRSMFPGSPAAQVFVDRSGDLDPPWDFENGRVGWVRADRDTCFRGYCFRIERLVLASGIGVRRDPGLWAVWLGFIMLCAGVFAVFLMPAGAMGVRIRRAGAGSQVDAGASGAAGADISGQLQSLREAITHE